jgi:inosine-uridine nucleoside N-ribohydrolase
MQQTDKVKVLFDTDIGTDIDDALALAYLLSQRRCELLGITTVTGEPTKRAEMASAICRQAGRDDIPIHAGCPEAMLIEMRQKTAPQAAALGDWSRRSDFAPHTAVDFLRTTIRSCPGDITLLAVGPMTNIGLLFAIDPEIPAMLKQVVLMCGRFFDELGGEWNAVGDPHATAIVYGNGRQARPPRHVSHGLDVTMRCVLDAETCRARFQAKVLQPVRDFAEVWFRRSGRITFHDPLAAACIFEPGLCTYRRAYVSVSLSEPTMGWTVPQNLGKPDAEAPHSLAAEVDSTRFFEHYFGTVR